MASESHSSQSKPVIIGTPMTSPSVISGQSVTVEPPVTAFVLRLPDHQKELHRFIWELFDSELHTDVTIALDDGQYIKAHKLILSAFSVYFRQVLTRIANPCQQTIIVVKDMHYEDVRSLVEFMYRGCVTVPDRRLQQLLKCAKQLKIRGLYELNEENNGQNHYNKCCKNVLNVSQTVETNSPIISDTKGKQFLCSDRKLVQKEPIIVENNVRNYSHNQEFVSDWLNKKSFPNRIPIPNPPKFVAPVMSPAIHKSIALDLTKRMSVHTSEPCLPMSTIRSSPVCLPGFASHPSLFRSISVDESQLNKNKFPFDEINGNSKRSIGRPSSLDGHLDSNNNDSEPDFRREKKRNLNIFHAAKYRNRKKQQLELLFNEESELQKKNCLAKDEIDKLESTILSLIWQHTKKTFQSQTVFSCPVCGNVQNEVPKLRSHINMLHNDTEALMKFLMLQRSPPFAKPAISANQSSNSNNSTKPVVVPNSTVSVPYVVQINQ